MYFISMSIIISGFTYTIHDYFAGTESAARLSSLGLGQATLTIIGQFSAWIDFESNDKNKIKYQIEKTKELVLITSDKL